MSLQKTTGKRQFSEEEHLEETINCKHCGGEIDQDTQIKIAAKKYTHYNCNNYACFVTPLCIYNCQNCLID